MERLQGIRWNRCSYTVIAILASNLLTFMISTTFYSDSLTSDVRCDYVKRLQSLSFRTGPPSQESPGTQHSFARSLQAVHQLNKPASEDSAADGIGSELLIADTYPPEVLDATDKPLTDVEMLSEEVPFDTVEDDFSTGDNIDIYNSTSDCVQCPMCNETITTQVVYVMKKQETNNVNCSQYPNQVTNHNINTTPQNSSDNFMKTIFIITPTYYRSTQKIDLTSMCHTLMLVPRVVWIIIEDAPNPTNLVTQLLNRCRVKTVHLTVHTSPAYRVRKGAPSKSKPRGVEQRNAGLRWLRQHYSVEDCNGVVYFGDDDNKYDLRLFEDIRRTRQASVWKVAWSGGLRWEGPTCRNGHATSWHSAFAVNKRALPVDMAAFAVDLCELIKRPKARVGVNIYSHQSKLGFLETDFLQHFTSRSKVECRGSEKEAYVWHSHTSSPSLHFERRARSSKAIET